MKSFFGSIKNWLTRTRFRTRFLVFGVLAFIMGFAVRFTNIFGDFSIAISLSSLAAFLFSAIWLVFGAFKKSQFSEALKKSKRFHRTKKLIAIAVIAPILFPATVATGVISAALILPYSESEIAEMEAQQKLQEQQDKLREEAEEAKRIAEQAEAAEREAIAAEEAEARKIVEAQEQEKRAAEEKARQEVEAEKQARKATEQQSEARAKELIELSRTNRLLYTKERCQDVIFGDDDIFGITSYISIGDNDKSLFLDTKSSSSEEGLAVYTCTYVSMQMSVGLMTSIGNTNALSGVRTWSEDGYSYEWTYHPSYGLNMIIRKDEQCFLGICI